jgi:hypothetical protein
MKPIGVAMLVLMSASVLAKEEPTPRDRWPGAVTDCRLVQDHCITVPEPVVQKTQTMPEPASLLVLGAGVAAIAALRKYRRK